MAFSKIQLNKDSWTLIGNNVTTISFQNSGQYPIYVATTTTNTSPSNTSVGLIYDSLLGELKVTPSSLTITGGNYVWAKAITTSLGSNIIVDV